MSTLGKNIFHVAEEPEKHTLKRLAWAYGCAKKGSKEEELLEQALLTKAAAVIKEKDDAMVVAVQEKPAADAG